MKKTLSVVAIVFALAFGAALGADAPTKENTKLPRFLTIATAGSGGGYYAFGIAFADVFTNVLGIQATSQVTGGSIENIVIVDRNECEIGISKPEQAINGWNGKAPYVDKHQNNRGMVAAISYGCLQAITLESSPINSFADLKGKRVVMGPAGGGTLEVTPILFPEYGFTEKDITPIYVSYSEGATMLKDGNCDAVLIHSAPPASAVMELVGTGHPIKFISIGEKELANMLKQSPQSMRIVVDKEMYNTKEPGITMGNMTMLIVNKDVPDDVVYILTKTVWDNVEKIKGANPTARLMKLEDAGKGFGIPIHPGAARYYAEKGVAMDPR